MSSEKLSILTKKGIDMETSFEKNTSSPNCVGHPHAENMKLYDEDAMTTNEPWKLWEGMCI